MIKVLLKGHEYKNEVYELIKLFYFDKEIIFVEDEALVEDQSLFIENFLMFRNNIYSVSTRIIINGECKSINKIDDITKIDIKEENLKKKIKIGIKHSLFEAISKISNMKVPWGILTGIRPTKIVHELMDKGYDIYEIKNVLLNGYKITDEKANLITEIANKQRDYIYPINEKKFSLYVSIPFCPTRCVYCSFPSNLIGKYSYLVNDYTEKLLYEIRKVGELLKDKVIETVYIGGGTPTSIPAKNLIKIVEEIHRTFGKDNIKEFTVEAGRPDTINKETLIQLKENSIHRISINPQTMKQDTLFLIGRKHTPDDIEKAYYLAKEIGFNIINMDIILGLPKEKLEDVEFTLKKILTLNPDNLTVHTMAVKRASLLRENLDYSLLTEQKSIEDMIFISRKYAKKMGMYPYYLYRQKQILGNFENVGYTKPGKECIYNILIMEEKQTIIAVGAGGVSKMYYPNENRIERVPNIKNIVEYNSRIDEMIDRKKKYLKPVDTKYLFNYN